MSREQRWVLRFVYPQDGAMQHGYAQRNPSTGEWTTVHAGFVQHATKFQSERLAQSALVQARPALAGSPWCVPPEAWVLLRAGDVGEPMTRFHDIVPVLMAGAA